jgi:aryl-alcohol dehydrogenase-like predicted oxidoreductase
VEPLRQRSELGAFLSDTAELYGPEEIVGRAVQGQREQVFVATKTGGSWWRFCTSG